MSQQGDDAQRDFEQRALRNVRGLLDKMEDQDRSHRRTTLRIAIACGLVAIGAVALVFLYSAGKSQKPAEVIVLPPAGAAR